MNRHHFLPSRRSVLKAAMLAGFGARVPALARGTPSLQFPSDAGAHPGFATEWWYVTGYINSEAQDAAFGFQITFFRSRIAKAQSLQSRFAARQLLFAHAAVTDIKGHTLWHEQRIARWSGAAPGTNPLDTAWASTDDTHVVLHDWSLARQGQDLQAHIPAKDFSLALTLIADQPVMLQGEQGLSRKGPDADATSYYYSLPHVQVQGDLVLQGRRHRIGAGSTAWLDHEWSQAYMPSQAVGWDWMGINLFDGSALMAFRMRNRAGGTVWDGGAFRTQNKLHNFAPGEVVFQPGRLWKSPLSQAIYPVEWLVRTPTDTYTVRAMLDNQEIDVRSSTGGIYWEGLCEVHDSRQHLVGRGYLEMTGYASPMHI